VQTFLPYPSFAASAAALDSPRLGKQRVETLQILRALVLPEYGWRNHPAVVMWRGYVPALVCYGLTCVAESRGRGHADSTDVQIAEFAPSTAGDDQDRLAARGLLPPWLGASDVHASHRTALTRKDPDRYAPLFAGLPTVDRPGARPRPAPGAEDGADGAGGRLSEESLAGGPDGGPAEPAASFYVWPGEPAPPAHPVDLDPAPGPTTGVWVVRPGSRARLGAFLELGVVGVGIESGVGVDVDGLDLAGMRAVLAEREPGRRAGRELTALASLVGEVQDGDLVGIPVEDGAGLLVGQVAGGYQLGSGRDDAPVHRRSVAWTGRRWSRAAPCTRAPCSRTRGGSSPSRWRPRHSPPDDRDGAPPDRRRPPETPGGTTPSVSSLLAESWIGAVSRSWSAGRCQRSSAGADAEVFSSRPDSSWILAAMPASLSWCSRPWCRQNNSSPPLARLTRM